MPRLTVVFGLAALLMCSAGCDASKKESEPAAPAPAADAATAPANTPDPAATPDPNGNAAAQPSTEPTYEETASPCVEEEKGLGKKIGDAPVEQRIGVLEEFVTRCGEELPRYKEMLEASKARGKVIVDGERLLSTVEFEQANDTHVTIKPDYVLVLNTAVLKLEEDGSIAEADIEGEVAPKLVGALKDEAKRRQALDAELNGVLTLIAIPEASDALVDQVLRSAQQAGFTHFRLARLVSRTGAEPPLAGEAPKAPCPAPSADSEALRITVRADGLCVHHKDVLLPALERCKGKATNFCAQDGKHNWVELYNTVIAYLAENPVETLEIAGQGVPYAFLVDAMDALRVARAPATATDNPTSAVPVTSFESAVVLRAGRKPIKLFESILVVP